MEAARKEPSGTILPGLTKVCNPSNGPNRVAQMKGPSHASGRLPSIHAHPHWDKSSINEDKKGGVEATKSELRKYFMSTEYFSKFLGHLENDHSFSNEPKEKENKMFENMLRVMRSTTVCMLKVRLIISRKSTQRPFLLILEDKKKIEYSFRLSLDRRATGLPFWFIWRQRAPAFVSLTRASSPSLLNGLALTFSPSLGNTYLSLKATEREERIAWRQKHLLEA